ncbi:Txe/YoeB family addiction module toxin [Pelagibacterium lacus]|uniref:Putative mRNA interferase YoeB n=1 Tax=Pelagibacterium lacus TaxID=2282655 RepID=A0A369W7L6_9HYPH|nr:Txe/YoeB family addiction module toxin [Pelagibacterium lacus]RDE10588.1 Txe/YoeB family addiction module toxin [Pelagibacterium lacus]
MRLVFSAQSWSEYQYWLEADPDMVRRINALLAECSRHPFKGRGKPEPLRGDLSGWWSRRITREHRLVYRVTGIGAAQSLEIAQLRYHY